MKKKQIPVPYISQKDKYPTGCESVSSVMLLQYLGYKITVDEWIENYLECQEFENRNGRLYGGDPRKVFCGNPYKEDGMGCYAPVICSTLNKIFEEDGKYEAVDETGRPIEELLQEYIDQDMPVIFWCCIDMKEPVTGPEWYLKEEPEKMFTWISNEHCMLLTGYDEDGYYFHDPYEDHGVIRCERLLTKNRHEAQYAMAVGIKNK